MTVPILWILIWRGWISGSNMAANLAYPLKLAFIKMKKRSFGFTWAYFLMMFIMPSSSLTNRAHVWLKGAPNLPYLSLLSPVCMKLWLCMRMFLSVLRLAARDVAMSIATETPTEGKWQLAQTGPVAPTWCIYLMSFYLKLLCHLQFLTSYQPVLIAGCQKLMVQFLQVTLASCHFPRNFQASMAVVLPLPFSISCCWTDKQDPHYAH